VYEKKETLNALMSLDDYSETMGINLNAVSPAALAMGRHDGRTYVIMTDYDRRVLVYNKTLLNKVSGVSDPALEAQNDNWTWDVFKEYCEKATMRENDNVTQAGASLHFGHPAVWLCFAEGFGGRWYDNSEIFFSENQETIQGLNTMVDFVKSGNAVPTFNDDVSSVLEGVFCDVNASQIIDAGKVYENAGYDWNVVSFPEFESHRSYVTSSGGFGAYKRNNNPDAAAALCLSLCTTEGAKVYNSEQKYCVPAVVELAKEDFWKTPIKESFKEKNDIFYDSLIPNKRIDRSGVLSSLIPEPVAEIVEKGMYELALNMECEDADLLEMLESIDKDANECWPSINKKN
jgi:ABC-type glycerol-3-phosphate transport system substrate-binding protein